MIIIIIYWVVLDHLTQYSIMQQRIINNNIIRFKLMNVTVNFITSEETCLSLIY